MGFQKNWCSENTLSIMLLVIFIGTSSCRNIKEPTSVPEGHTKAIRTYLTLTETSNEINVTLKKSNSITEKEANILLAKNSYCTCKCCHAKGKDSNVCRKLVRYDLPKNYKCPERFCTKIVGNDCSKWNKHRCEKACFCQKCKGLLPEEDGRCSGELEPANGCICRGHENIENDMCRQRTQGLATIWHFLTAAKMNKKFLSCQMGCFCTFCNHTVLSQVFKGMNTTVMCKAHSSVPNHCTKPCPPCPDYVAANKAKQTLKDVWRLQGSHGG